MGIMLAVLVSIAGMMIWRTLHPKTLPENLVEGTGRIDGDLTNLNTKYPGRVKKIFVEDGMVVKKGMVVAVLGSKEQEAQKAQIEAQIQAQKEMLEAKKSEARIADETIPLALKKAKEQPPSLSTLFIRTGKEPDRNLITDKELKVYNSIDGRRDMYAIISNSGLGGQEVFNIVSKLLAEDLIEPVES